MLEYTIYNILCDIVYSWRTPRPELEEVMKSGKFQGMDVKSRGPPPSFQYKSDIINAIVDSMNLRFSEVNEGVLRATEVINLKIWPPHDDKEQTSGKILACSFTCDELYKII